MNRNFIVIGLLIFGLIGILFIGSGITGKVVNDSYYFKLCSNNNECSSNETCCLFYQQTSGVCNPQGNCEKITEITKNDASKMENWKKMYYENAQQNTNYTSLIVTGVLIILIVLVGIFFAYKSEKKTKAKRKSKKKKNSRKKK